MAFAASDFKVQIMHAKGGATSVLQDVDNLTSRSISISMGTIPFTADDDSGKRKLIPKLHSRTLTVQVEGLMTANNLRSVMLGTDRVFDATQFKIIMPGGTGGYTLDGTFVLTNFSETGSDPDGVVTFAAGFTASSWTYAAI